MSLSERAAPVLRISHVFWTIILPHAHYENDPIMLASLAEAFFPLVPKVARILYYAYKEDCLAYSCDVGSLSLARWLLEHRDFFSNSTISAGIRSCYKNGRLSFLQYLSEQFGLLQENADAECIALFSCGIPIACKNGHLETIMWATKQVELEEVESLIRIGFWYACSNGHLAVAKWLLKFYGLTPKHLKTSEYTPLASFGSPSVAKWLTKHFNLTAYDARSCDNQALRTCCANGDITTAKWLVQKFGLTKSDVSAMQFYAFRKACAHGHVEVAKWLTITFDIDGQDARVLENYAFTNCCSHGHIHTAKWLVKQFALNSQDVRCRNLVALFNAAGFGYSDVASWLKKHFNLTVEDAKILVTNTSSTFPQVQQNIWTWVKKEFGDALSYLE